MTVTAAASGAEALEIMSQRKFDVALVDLQMPDMDGPAVARKLLPETKTPLILLSSTGEKIAARRRTSFSIKLTSHQTLLPAQRLVEGNRRQE